MAAHLFGKMMELRYCARNETSLSAKKAQTSAHARLFGSSGTKAPHTKAAQGTRTSFGIGMAQRTRLTRADFSLLRASRRIHGEFFSLSVSPLPRRGPSSFACVVSKSVCKKATERNLLKRRCRESVLARLHTAPSGLALVFRAKSAARNAGFTDIARDVANMMAQL